MDDWLDNGWAQRQRRLQDLHDGAQADHYRHFVLESMRRQEDQLRRTNDELRIGSYISVMRDLDLSTLFRLERAYAQPGADGLKAEALRRVLALKVEQHRARTDAERRGGKSP